MCDIIVVLPKTTSPWFFTLFLPRFSSKMVSILLTNCEAEDENITERKPKNLRTLKGGSCSCPRALKSLGSGFKPDRRELQTRQNSPKLSDTQRKQLFRVRVPPKGSAFSPSKQTEWNNQKPESQTGSVT